MKKTTNKQAFTINGFIMLAVVVLGYLAGVGLLMIDKPLPGVITLIIASLLSPGLFSVQPNDSRVLIFLGNYSGTVSDEGFWWANPFAIRKKASLRIRNFSSDTIKVNDSQGNPIEIAAVVVWKVTNPASAIFDVDNYEEFVVIQSETAIRTLSTHYPYDNHEHDGISLRGNPTEVAETLKQELQNRLEVAGVLITEARLSHLAYAPEIAQAMLRRQQAHAIIAARQQIVEGAVGMVQMALTQLSEKDIVILDDERKANMVNNLMVALVSEHETQPIINAGSLY